MPCDTYIHMHTNTWNQEDNLGTRRKRDRERYGGKVTKIIMYMYKTVKLLQTEKSLITRSIFFLQKT